MMAAKKKTKAKKTAVKATPKAAPKATKGAPAKPAAAPASTVRTPAVGKGGSKPKHLAGRPNTTLAQQQAKVAATLNKINTDISGKNGPPIVIPADAAHSNSHVRRPTGILQLDVDLGGGFPAQALVTVGGPPQSAKSTLLYHTFAQHQRIYGEYSFIAMASPEGGIDYIQARRCGWIIPTPLNVIEAMQMARAEQGYPPLTKEEVAELRRSVGTNTLIETGTMEEILDATEDLLRSNLYGIIGIDSYESLIPRAEAGLDSLEDNAQQAARANLITRFLQHYGPIKREHDHYTTLMMTTQVRTNRKKMEAPGPMQKYLPDYSDDKSAWALQHWRSIHVQVSSGEKLKEGSSKTVVGKQINWKLPKGKEGTHDNIVGDTPYYYDARGFNLYNTVLLTGLRYGVIREVDGKFTFFRNGEPDDYLCHIDGKDQFVQALQEAPEIEWDVRREVCIVAGVSSIYC